MFFNKKKIALLAATVAASVALSTASAATWRYALGFPSGVPIQTAKTYAEEIKKSTDNRYSIRIYETSLLNLSEMSEGINKGLTDVGYLLTAYSPSEYPYSNLGSELSMSTALDSDVFGKEAFVYTGAMLEYVMLNCSECLDELSKNNQVYTSLVLTPPYTMLCNAPITTIEEIKGKRIRISGASWARWVRDFEAQPVSLPITEMYEALSQGVVDCTFVSPTELTNFNLIEVVRHITTDVPGGLFATGAATTLNKKRWNQLSAEDKVAFLKAGAMVSAVGSTGYNQQALDDLEKARKKGTPVVSADPAVLEKSRAFIQKDLEYIPTYFTQEYGLNPARTQELSTTMIALIDKWKTKINSMPSLDTDSLYNVYWDEIYSKVDVNTYGK